LVTQGYELFLSIRLVPVALTSLVKPFGRPLLPTLPVTPKGRDGLHQHLEWGTLSGLLVITAGLLGGIVNALWTGRVVANHTHELAALLLWTGYSLAVVIIAGMACIELPYVRTEERFEVDEPGLLWVKGENRGQAVRIANLSLTGARVSGDVSVFRPGTMADLEKQDVGKIPCLVLRVDPVSGWAALRVTAMDTATRHRLICSLFQNPRLHQHPVARNGWTVTAHLVRRLFTPDI
jgi:cellulose synthase (UDP-forming)